MLGGIVWRALVERLKGGAFSLRAHLIAFGIAILVPVSVLMMLLLVRSASLEREQLEARLLQVADTLADDVDREHSNLITLLKRLASSPALQSDNIAAFHAQAAAAVEGWGVGVFLVDPGTLKQVLNTLVPWGTPLPETGDPATVLRVAWSRPANRKCPITSSDASAGAPPSTSTFPSFGAARSATCCCWALNPEHLLTILQGQRLGPGWVTAIQDRRSAGAHARARALPRHNPSAPRRRERCCLSRTVHSDQPGDAARGSSVSGWFASSNISLAVAEAPLRRSLWLWGGRIAVAAGLTIALAWLFERGMSRPMRFASRAAGALSRGGVVPPLSSRGQCHRRRLGQRERRTR